ncbi:MAG TPA: LamG-like jellyroll fold domain-containing protein, partial [Ignavibacteriaceae bacterium]|nr:LamG-like jellyroll fold domain-containing protein [Ignavibacteriaceae bacterium]
MKTKYRIFYFAVIAGIFTISSNYVSAQTSNNAFMFDGKSSSLYVYDGQPANTDADQNGFKFFNSNSSNNQITVQAWIYLLGDTPPDVEVPVIYRAVNNGTTFSMYVKNNKGYFAVGNNNSAVVNTSEFTAFNWIALTGSYDGSNLKIYLGGSLQSTIPFNINSGYSVTNGSSGLFVGKSSSGAFKGLIDEIRIFNTALGDNNINGSGGNGNPAESFPTSIAQYLTGQWSFTKITNGNLLNDLSGKKNNLFVNNITQIFPSKNLPFFVVTSTSDSPDALPGDGKAASLNGQVTLRSAIGESNALAGKQIIYFYIPENGPFIISPQTPLPVITDPLIIDATLQRGYSGSPVISVDGTFSGEVDGLTLSAGASLVQGLSISNFSHSGIVLSINGGNEIKYNSILNNGTGVSVKSGSDNSILYNLIYSNAAAGIDLWTQDGNAGITANDPLDADQGANHLQNFPVLTDFYSGNGGTSIAGYLESVPNQVFNLQFFSNSPSSSFQSGEIYIGEKNVTTNSQGRAEFQANFSNAEVDIAGGYSVSSTATDVNKNTSEFSAAITAVLDDGKKYLLNKTLGGLPLHWKNGEAKYTISSSVSEANSSFPLEIEEAFNAYKSLEELSYTLRSLPPDSINNNWGGNPDGLNNVVWMTPDQWVETELPSNVLASTRVRYNSLTGENIDIDIAFNSVPHSTTQNLDFQWSASGSGSDGKLDVRNVAAHEIGHFTGMKDLYNPGDPAYILGIGMGDDNQEQTLYGRININEIKKRTLYDDGNTPKVEGDIAGIEAIYNAVDNSLADIVLVFDGSLNFTSENVYNGFIPSLNSALELVNKLRDGDRVAVINSNSSYYSLNGFNREGALNYISALVPGGDGNLAQRLSRAQTELQTNGNPNRQKLIILFSVGEEFSSPSILDN